MLHLWRCNNGDINHCGPGKLKVPCTSSKNDCCKIHDLHFTNREGVWYANIEFAKCIFSKTTLISFIFDVIYVTAVFMFGWIFYYPVYWLKILFVGKVNLDLKNKLELLSSEKESLEQRLRECESRYLE